MKIKLTDLWRWDGTMNRRQYLIWGMLLFAIKFNVDRMISSLFFGKSWSIFAYAHAELFDNLSSTTDRLHLATLLAVSLPFLWLGLLLTVKRLRAAGLSPWLVVLFVAPVAKFVFFAILCLLPSRQKTSSSHARPQTSSALSWSGIIPKSSFGSAVMGILVAVLLALLATWLETNVLRNYGWSLFVGLPFCMGFFSVLVYGFHQRQSLQKCLLVALYTVLLTGAGLILFAFEGALCLVMAAPLAIPLALIGGAVAYAIQNAPGRRAKTPKLYCSMLLLVPFITGVERFEGAEPPLFKVTSSVIVNASPEIVWRNVVTFSDLPPPGEWIFRFGIAYPVRAEIRGRGVGAVRYCNFSTGPFVEPIEVWDEPQLLKFSVSQNPSPMQELTPYHDLHPPHLNGFLVSRVGQFHLVRLENGNTLLEGTTWYHHNLWPAQYWRLWSDFIIHKIHLRVLNHVKKLSEALQE